MRIFDRKFGADFLAAVPLEPGIYRMYDAAGGLLYVGKARNLRRRLAQYRTARRTKKDRKRRALVRSADRIEWQVCASELDASLTEIGLIHALRPRRNVAGAFPFLYPFIGMQVNGADTRFCLTTSPGERLKRLMSGVMTAPTMNPPATIDVPCSRLSCGPAGAALSRSPTL